MSEMTPTDREQQAREFIDLLKQDFTICDDLHKDPGWSSIKLCDLQYETVKLLAATERATLERVILVQCSKCNARDQYGEAVVEVGQWMHQHIRSLTWTLCDAGRIQAYLKTKEIPS